MLYDLVIRGGSVVTPRGTIYADIAIDGEHIVEVGPELPGAREEINAFRQDVLPGLIDVHLHFNEPGRTEWEGAETGSRALAAGGGTLFFDMPLNSSPCTLDARAFDEKRRALEAASITDFGLWGGLVPGNTGAMEELAQCGAVGFKAFLCDSGLPEFPRADDLTLYEGMREAARLGLPVAVHAESEEITKGLTTRMLAAGRNDIAAFLESRPVIAEVEAITRAGVIARETGCRLHIVHISSGRGVAAALEARAAGADISLETCPHYLFFCDEDLLAIGAAAKCAPPLREFGEQSALREAVFFGKVDMAASDHSPCPPEMKQRDNFFEVWGGIAGVQWTLPVLIDLRYHVPRIAELTSINCARRFNIAGRGAIEPGSFAEITIVDVNRKQTVREENMFHRHRISPYAGMELQGVVRKTIRRGEVIYSDGTITARTKGKLAKPERKRNA
ncbi:MAG TPA: allantoinase AllB [Bryobacteraceae bacterium]|nr:allantoinase AllB [Bryobacteraceae bacterium]